MRNKMYINDIMSDIVYEYKNKYSIIIGVIGRARSGKSIFSFYLGDKLSYLLNNEIKWYFGYDNDVLNHKDSVIIIDEIGRDLYLGGKYEYKVRDIMYKYLLTSQINHNIYIFNTISLKELSIMRRYLNYIFYVKYRTEDSVKLKKYKVYYDNLLSKLKIKFESGFSIRFDDLFLSYNKYKDEYEKTKMDFVNNFFNISIEQRKTDDLKKDKKDKDKKDEKEMDIIDKVGIIK
jgi:hypothetical protein